MKKNLSAFIISTVEKARIIVALFFTLAIITTHRAQTLCPQGLFYDSFESGNYTPTWTLQSTNSSYTVTTGSAAVGTMKLEGTGISTSHGTGLVTNLAALTPTYVSWYIYPTGTSASNYVVFGDNSMTSTNCICFCYWNASGGGISFASSPSYLYSCSSSSWYKIELKNINYTAHTFDIWINNVLQQTSFNFRSATQNSISRFHLYAYTSGQSSQWDAIQLGSGMSVSVAGNSVSCYGGANGTASVTANQAVGAITYTWVGASSTSSIASNLTAGPYTVSVTDANSCTATTTFSVTQSASITPIYSVTNVSCFGGSNGIAAISPTGGVAPFTYTWSSSATGSLATNLSAGVQTVTIKDSYSCTATSTVNVVQPATAVSATANVTNISCFGGSNGSVSVNASGGTGTHSYSWIPVGGTGSSAQNLPLGTYTCLVKDANNCIYSTLVTIAQPPVVSAVLSQTNITCVGASAAQLMPAGGTPPYTYTWSPWGGSSQLMSNLSPGTHVGTVIDVNGCALSQSLSITTNTTAPVVNASSSRTMICKGESATLTVNGSADTYSWSNGSTNTLVAITPTTITNYTVTGTTTSNGCNTSLVFIQYVKNCTGIGTIPYPEGLINLYPNPSAGEFTIDLPHAASVQIFQVTGSMVFSSELHTGQNTINLSTLPNGIYFVKVSDATHHEVIRVIKN